MYDFKKILTPITLSSAVLFLSMFMMVYAVTTIKHHTTRAEAANSTSVAQTISYQINTILGQPNDRETMSNEIVANRGFHLGGVHLDSQNRVYVLDSGNNRILGFNSFSGNANQNADIVIGQVQPTLEGTANGNNTQYTQPSDRTIALEPYPNLVSTAESPRSGQMATDQADNLYIVDTENNRVLKFNTPFTTDTIADEVWGQTDFTSREPSCGQDGKIPSASTFCLSSNGLLNGPPLGWTYTAAVTIDQTGNLWVTDVSNYRVLRFPNTNGVISKTADLVLGQTNFTQRAAPSDPWNKSLSQMQKPVGVKMKPTTGEVYIVEGEWAGQARILVFTAPFSNGMSAVREIGKATFQNTQPPDTTNWEQIDGKWVQPTTGLSWSRGITFDPSGTGDVFALDSGNQRAVLFGHDGAIMDTIGQPLNKKGCLGHADQGYQQVDGSITNLCQADGGIGVDSQGNIYISTISTVDSRGVARFATPLQKNASGRVISNGWLLHGGWNQFSGRTWQDAYGMSRSYGANPQLFLSDGQRMLVWNNPDTQATFSPADYVVGQDTFDQNKNYNGGTFHAVGAGQQSVDPAGFLYVASNNRIFVFTLPITATGKNYPIHKMLFSNSANSSENVVWEDNGAPVDFDPTGVAFDPTSGVLFVADPSHQRILRIKNPRGAATVDMVIGQPSKTATSPNAGNSTPVRNGLHNPTYISFDNFGNLYVVDASYELGGNRRALRFNASLLTPQPSNIFPMPNASAVFSKSSFTTNAALPNEPGSPVTLGFDSQNRMILVADGYANPQFQRVFVYNTPHEGEIIQASGVVGIPIAQGASVKFDESDRLILQDHTWNRIVFATLDLSVLPTPTLSPTSGPTPTNTPIPPSPTQTPTPILTPTPTPTPTQPQLVLNPDFETDANGDGKPDNWSSNNKFTRSSASFHGGAFSGRHFSSSNAGWTIDQTISNITGNTSYSFGAWTNIPPISDSFTYKYQLLWKNSSGSTIKTDTVKQYTASTAGWNQTTTSLTSPSNARSVIIRMATTSVKGPIYTDDVSFKKN